jgi:hypothetical protein
VPAWCKESSISPSGAKPGADGYTALRRNWKSGDAIDLNLKLEPRVVVGDHLNQGRAAILYGPLVLAADEALLTSQDRGLRLISLPGPDVTRLNFRPEPAPADLKTWPEAQVFQVNAGIARTTNASNNADIPIQIQLTPFADAGASGTPYEVWLPLRPVPGNN